MKKLRMTREQVTILKNVITRYSYITSSKDLEDQRITVQDYSEITNLIEVLKYNYTARTFNLNVAEWFQDCNLHISFTDEVIDIYL